MPRVNFPMVDVTGPQGTGRIAHAEFEANSSADASEMLAMPGATPPKVLKQV